MSKRETIAAIGVTAHDGFDDDTTPLPTGAKIGRYVVLDVVGRGGMGVVYRAYDPDLERPVALKLLRAPGSAEQGTSGRNESQEKLLREAQAMAKVSHPNVLPVYDIGVLGERIFIAAEYVHGQTLQSWLKTRRSWKETLPVFISAGRGLAAVHATGIVHRDFKPANVLIGEDGAARVTDFGLARRVDDSQQNSTPSFTRNVRDWQNATFSTGPWSHAGAIVGTPGYMAPEQYLGEEVGAAADQFAFCVSLFEALYRKSPFEGSTISEIIAAVCEGRFVIPAAETKVPSWLTRAVIRGLSPRAEERWPSMPALLSELSRDRRRWWGSVTAGVVVAGLITLGAMTLGQRADLRAEFCGGAEERLKGIWDADGKARMRRAFDTVGVSHANATWSRVESRLDEYTHEWIALNVKACADTKLTKVQSEELYDVQMACLRQRRSELKTATDLFSRPNADIVTNAVKIVNELTPVASCAEGTGTDDARLLSDVRLRRAVGDAREHLAEARVLVNAARYAEATKLIDTALELARREKLFPLLAEASFAKGQVLLSQGLAKPAYEQLAHAAWAADSAQLDGIAADAKMRLVFASGYYLHDLEAARMWELQADAAVRRLGIDVPRQARLAYYRGALASASGHYNESLALFEEAKALYERAFGPQNSDTVKLRNSLGMALHRVGRYDEASDHLHDVVAIWSEVLGTGHPHFGIALTNLSSILVSQGQYERAIERQRQAIEILREASNEDVVVMAEAQHNIIQAALGLDDLERAGQHCNEVEAMLEANATNSALALPSFHCGMLAMRRGDFEAAHATFNRAQKMVTSTFGNEHPSVGIVLMGLARTQLRAGALEESLRSSRESVRILERAGGPRHPDVAVALSVRGETLLARGDFPEALGDCDRAASIQAERLRARHPELADSLTCKGRALHALGRDDEAAQHLQRAVDNLLGQDVAPYRRAYAEFELAQLRVKRDAVEARRLADSAHRDFLHSGAAFAREAERVEQWLAEHVKRVTPPLATPQTPGSTRDE